MERQEKIQRLVERMKVTAEEAAKALDEAGGDLLDAALLLERGRVAGEQVVHTHSTAAQALAVSPQPEEAKAASTEDKVKEILTAVFTGLVTHPILNGMRIEYKGNRLAIIPAGILLALFLVRYWIALGLIAVGLVAGWSFTWTGPQWGNATLNAAWNTLEGKIADLRASMRAGHSRR